MKISVVGARGIPSIEGGAEKNAEALFPLVARKHEVTLYAIRGVSQIEKYNGVKIKYAPQIYILGTEKLPCYVYAFLRSLRDSPDIVHLQGLGSALFLCLYKMFGFKVVVRYGSADYDMEKWSTIGRWGFRFCEWQLRFADAVIAVTPSLKKRLRERGFRMRTEIIPNALDPIGDHSGNADIMLEKYGLERESYVLGIGRLTAQKDFLTLIRGFSEFRALGTDNLKKLVIVGGDDGSGYFEKLAAESNCDVVLTGRLPRPTVQALLSECGVYVNSSVHEGMSNAILEAVSLGKPILLSDIIENHDLPVHKRHFFTAGNPTALANSLENVVANPLAYVASTALFTHWEEVAARTLALYESLFEGKDPVVLTTP